ncbi:MAG: hypothetical protein IKU83_02675 [Lachnospiraceae bacterium]|nr:hypothetical protein [Lachnospiraceae bacterium]
MKKSKIFVLGFLVCYTALLLANLLTPDKVMSDEENRYLAEAPEWSLKAFFAGNFDTDFETYVSDQFVGRTELVKLSVEVDHLLVRKEGNGVYYGPNGFLVEAFQELNKEQWAKNMGYLEAFSAWCEKELGQAPTIMLVPTVSHVLPNLVADGAPEVNQETLFAEAAAKLPGFFDVTDALREHGDEYIYYRTDHHWTSLGAFYAYQAMKEGDADLEDYETWALSKDFLGTTYKKVLRRVTPDWLMAMYPKSIQNLKLIYNMGMEERDTYYDESFLGGKDQYSTYLGGNKPLIQMNTGVENGKKLLLIKDSYANCFAQFLLEDYEEIYMVDLRHFNYSMQSFAKEQGITDVLVLYNVKGFSEEVSLFWVSK